MASEKLCGSKFEFAEFSIERTFCIDRTLRIRTCTNIIATRFISKLKSILNVMLGWYQLASSYYVVSQTTLTKLHSLTTRLSPTFSCMHLSKRDQYSVLFRCCYFAHRGIISNRKCTSKTFPFAKMQLYTKKLIWGSKNVRSIQVFSTRYNL